MIIRKATLAAAVASLTLTTGIATASLEQEMNKLFGGISNVTDPSAVSGMQRGVVQGGSLYVRTPLTRVTPVNIQMPRIDAGCGGIDMFGGSFSFINKDQYIQLLRSIAGNATGYAFKLALTTLSPMIGGITEDLQKSISALNSAALDSCNITQNLFAAAGATPESAAVLGEKLRSGAGTQSALATGLSTGIDAIGGVISKINDPLSNLTPAGQNQMYETGAFGNATWRMLNEGGSSITTWFEFGGTELANAIMSYTGSMVITPPAPSSESATGSVAQFVEPTIEIRHLYEGNVDKDGNIIEEITLFNCAAYEDSDPSNNRAAVCLTLPDANGVVPPMPITTTAALTGMLTRVQRLLLGDGVNPGIAGKIAGVAGAGALTPQEEALVSLEPALHAKMTKLSDINPQAVQAYARDVAHPLAIVLTEALVFEVLDALSSSAAQNTHIAGAGDIAAKARELRATAKKYLENQSEKSKHRSTLLAIGDNYIDSSPPIVLSPGSSPGPSQGNGGQTPAPP